MSGAKKIKILLLRIPKKKEKERKKERKKKKKKEKKAECCRSFSSFLFFGFVCLFVACLVRFSYCCCCFVAVVV